MSHVPPSDLLGIGRERGAVTLLQVKVRHRMEYDREGRGKEDCRGGENCRGGSAASLHAAVRRSARAAVRRRRSQLLCAPPGVRRDDTHLPQRHVHPGR